MSTYLQVIVNKYKDDDKIVNELGLDVENVLEFEANEKYIFLYYGNSSTPRLGSLE